jgi:hypothetical protein
MVNSCDCLMLDQPSVRRLDGLLSLLDAEGQQGKECQA